MRSAYGFCVSFSFLSWNNKAVFLSLKKNKYFILSLRPEVV